MERTLPHFSRISAGLSIEIGIGDRGEDQAAFGSCDLVGEVRVELTWVSPGDFKSPASAIPPLAPA